MNPAPTSFKTTKGGIKMPLIPIATAATAIALIAVFGLVLLNLHWLFYLTLIGCLIGAAALIADFISQ